MTKTAALHKFASSFGIAAYQEHAVPCNANFPYLTYSVITDSFSENETPLTFSLWYRTTSWAEINAKTEEISRVIGYGGLVVDCDGGKMWIKRGQPFASSMGDNSDDLIKRKLINVSVEYLTFD